jgi:hypothetical protein
MITNISQKTSGEPSIESLATGLGTLGRYGDNYMVHAAEGETVVPREVLEANPGLKEDLFRQMQMAGIENPNRYVVGNEFNSINPVTGQPEFFFKRVWRAVKKIGKKVLPIVAPIVGNMILPGIGGLIASGLVTKMQGGSWADALKSAAIAYAGQSVLGGLKGMETFGGKGGFGQGFMDAASAPWQAGSNLFSSGADNPLAQGIFGESLGFSQPSYSWEKSGLFPKYNPNAATPAAATLTTTSQPATDPAATTTTSQPATDPAATTTTSQPMTTEVNWDVDVDSPYYNPETGSFPADAGGNLIEYSGVTAPGTQVPSTEGVIKATSGNATDYASGQRVEFADGKIRQAVSTIGKDGVNVGNQWKDVGSWNTATARGLEAIGVGQDTAFNIAPYVKTAALAGGAAAAAYALSPEEEERVKSLSELEMEAYDKWSAMPDKNTPEAIDLYYRWMGRPTMTKGQVAESIGVDVGRMVGPGFEDWRYLTQAAGGGEVMGPGTGTSDSIPARLSDGEFVMTARAVRNAGGGDRSLGAARMYDMMNRFEQGAA